MLEISSGNTLQPMVFFLEGLLMAGDYYCGENVSEEKLTILAAKGKVKTLPLPSALPSLIALARRLRQTWYREQDSNLQVRDCWPSAPPQGPGQHPRLKDVHRTPRLPFRHPGNYKLKPRSR